MLDVTHDADNLAALRVRRVEFESLADRIFVGEILPREHLIDERYEGRVFAVFSREETTANEIDAHRFEVIRTHDIEQPVRILARRRRGLTFEHDRRKVCTFKRKTIR